MKDVIIQPNLHFIKRSAVSRTIISWAFIGTTSLMVAGLNLAYANTLTSIDSATANTSVDKYNADYFIAFEPQTLYEMVEKIPGGNSVLVAMNSASQSRGFGSAGDQILINNKRVSGKENNIQNELNNIQAQDVDHIELIRGTRSDLDVQSNGLVINVVLKKHIESSILWSLGSVETSNLGRKPLGSVVFNASHGELKYRIGLSHKVNPTQFTNIDQYISPEQKLTDTYTRTRKNFYQKDQLTGKIEYQYSDKTALQVNGLFEKVYVDANYTIIHDDWLSNERNKNNIIYDWERDSWELSGDISHELNESNQLKLLFISNKLDANDQLRQVLLHDDQTTTPNYQLPRLYVAKENVLRSNWKYKLDSQHSFDSGLEVAINSHKENLQFIRQSGTAYQSTEINDIKETRYEAFLHYNFTHSADLNLQSSLVYERATMDVATDFSLLSETNNTVNNQSSRTFSYLKPRVNIRYDINDIYQMRVNYERTVSQLRLKDFVPWFNREETRLEETNPDLKPEMRDEFSASLEKQWLNTNGSLTLTPYYHKISDLLTEVPLAVRSGGGNVDNGKEYGLKLATNFGLAAIGLDNTLISASYTWRDSQMKQPFTGENAAIERLSDNEWNIKLNQNELLPGLSFSLTLKNQSHYQFSRFDYQGRLKRAMTANVFLDYKISKHLKVRLNGENLLGRKSSYQRTRHTGRFTQSEVLRQEQRSNEFTPRFSLTLTGQF